MATEENTASLLTSYRVLRHYGKVALLAAGHLYPVPGDTGWDGRWHWMR